MIASNGSFLLKKCSRYQNFEDARAWYDSLELTQIILKKYRFPLDDKYIWTLILFSVQIYLSSNENAVFLKNS
jgi:hypothetical protein